MKVNASFSSGVVVSNTEEAQALYAKSRFGEKVGDRIQYSLSECLFLVEKGKVEVVVGSKVVSKGKI
ncbi:hypothetical protein ACFL0X_02555 [Nanoarchaeota archaeon]